MLLSNLNILWKCTTCWRCVHAFRKSQLNKAFTLNSRHMLITSQSTQPLSSLKAKIKQMIQTRYVENLTSQTYNMQRSLFFWKACYKNGLSLLKGFTNGHMHRPSFIFVPIFGTDDFQVLFVSLYHLRKMVFSTSVYMRVSTAHLLLECW